MTVKLLTQHHLEFLILKGGYTGRMSLHLSKYHIVGNHVTAQIFIHFNCINMAKHSVVFSEIWMCFTKGKHNDKICMISMFPTVLSIKNFNP